MSSPDETLYLHPGYKANKTSPLKQEIQKMLRNSDTDMLTHLPSDLAKEIAKDFDGATTCSALQVSKNWNALFTYPAMWKDKIIRDFNIKEVILAQFPSELVGDTYEANHFYKKIYQKLNHLKNQNKYNNSFAFKMILQDPDNHFFLIACCADNFMHISTILKEQYVLCFRIALYARCNNILKAILDKYVDDISRYLELAITSGNVELVSYIASHASKHKKYYVNQSLSPDNLAGSGRLEMMTSFIELDKIDLPQEVLWKAAESGSIALTSFLLDSKKLKLDDVTLLKAIRSGNIKLVAHLYALNNQSDNKIILTPELMSREVVLSDNTEMIPYIFNQELNLKFKPNHEFIPDLIKTSCGFEMIDIILKENDLSEMHGEYLKLAIENDSKEIVSYFLDPKNNFKFKPDQSILKYAMECRGFAVFSYLLDPGNEFKLKLDKNLCNTDLPDDDSRLLKPSIKAIVKYCEYKSYIDITDLKKDFEKVTSEEIEKTIDSSSDEIIEMLADMHNIDELILSTAFFDTAIEILTNGQPYDLMQLDIKLYSSYKLSPLHFYQSMEHIFKKPEWYQLNDVALQSLHSFMKKLPDLQSPLQRIRFSERHKSEMASQVGSILRNDPF